MSIHHPSPSPSSSSSTHTAEDECCTLPTEKPVKSNSNHGLAGDDCCNTDAQTVSPQAVAALSNIALIRLFLPAAISMLLLLVGLALEHWLQAPWFTSNVRLIWYTLAYIPVGFPVIRSAFHAIKKGEVFSEFFLMSIATLGAFAIGEYPEGVAVMLFYTVGENFQALAVRRAKRNIQSLLDQRPDEVTVLKNAESVIVRAEQVKIGDVIQLRSGEKVGLDGQLLSDKASFDTATLTGESQPDSKRKGDTVLAGMINLHSPATIQVTAAYADSKLSRILELVQNASTQKAPTELFIRKFAKIYTPIVVFLALGIALGPYFFVHDYVFSDWLYRALVFLVISCPCALVISIPLGYFGGIGASSRNGILVKGGNFLDVLANIDHVVMDKTGTMTEGVFEVQEVMIDERFDKQEVLQAVYSLEQISTHPVATAIEQYVGSNQRAIPVTDAEEIAGHGLRGIVNGKEYLAGNLKLLDLFEISYDIQLQDLADTLVVIAIDGVYAGFIRVADQLKPQAARSIQELHAMRVQTMMLSGDKNLVVQKVAKELGIGAAYGDLLPEDKLKYVQKIKSARQQVAFVGDGLNDAPVVALSDVGIAMGGLGSDATIETADVVIQDDNPMRIPVAIKIGKATKRIVWQNVALAFGVKAVVLCLGAGGIASLWEAVFADVGVALLAILNAIRIQRMNFR